MFVKSATGGGMRDFREIKAWQKSHQLTLKLYALTKSFPKDEIYGLTSQIRRATVSIGCNIAEGCGRSSDAELGRFLTIAAGSAAELEYQLLLSRDLGFLSQEEYARVAALVTELKKMLAAFIGKLKRDSDELERRKF
jgi:four helix bundle protein